MRVASLLILCWITGDLCGQEQVSIPDPRERMDSLRETYIQRFPDHFFVYPVLKQRSLSFELATSNRTRLLTFKPNNTFSVGVGLYLFEVGAELAFAL